MNTLQIGVFGEIAGYYAAWERYGRVRWVDLFEPTIDLCDHGFIVAPALGRVLSNKTFQARAKRNEGNMRFDTQ